MVKLKIVANTSKMISIQVLYIPGAEKLNNWKVLYGIGMWNRIYIYFLNLERRKTMITQPRRGQTESKQENLRVKAVRHLVLSLAKVLKKVILFGK